MRLRKNWLYFLIVSFAALGMLYIFSHSFVSLEERQEYGYFLQGALLLVLFGVWILVRLSAAACCRFGLDARLSRDKKWVKWAETGFAGFILVLAVIVRMQVIGLMPETYLQEYKNYYEIAQALMEDSIQRYGEGYCDLIAATPTTMGYSYLLMLAFKMFGEGVRAGQYLNVFFSVAAAFLSYKIASKTGGRTAGITALILCAFWPSRIAAVSVLSSESAFVFLALLCIWLFLSLVMDYDGDTPDALLAVLLHLVLGAMLAVASAVNAISVILLLAMLLMLIPQRMKLPAKPKNDIPLMVRALEWGWLRCIMILIPYIILAGVISSNIELAIDRNLPFMGIAYGSSLWEEIRTDADGTSSDRMEQLAERAENLFKNEDYGIDKCRELLEEQEGVNNGQKDFTDKIGSINQVIYVGTLFFALSSLFYLLYKEANPAFLLTIIFSGIIVISFLTGTENEYAFIVPQIFILLTSMTVWYTFTEGRYQSEKKQTENELLLKENEMEEYKLKLKEQEEEKLADLRKEAYANIFDMEKALKEGHIIMTVSQAYAEELSNRKQENDEARKEVKDGETKQEKEIDEDDFDWKFTDEELNDIVSSKWALVQSLKDGEKQKQEG